MDLVVNEMANIGLTILILVGGWAAIYWLDRNIFNKGRYPRKKDKK